MQNVNIMHIKYRIDPFVHSPQFIQAYRMVAVPGTKIIGSRKRNIAKRYHWYTENKIPSSYLIVG